MGQTEGKEAGGKHHRHHGGDDHNAQGSESSQRVYLDMTLKGVTELIPPPKELLPFVMDVNPHDTGFVFRYIEALSLESNKLTSLRGLEKVLHLPLLIELNVSNNLIESVDDGTPM